MKKGLSLLSLVLSLGLFPFAAHAGLLDCINLTKFIGRNSTPTDPAQAYAALTKWRAKTTNQLLGETVPTSRSREKYIQRDIASLENSINRKSTPSFAYYMGEGTQSRILKRSKGYKSGEITELEVSSLTNGELPITFLLPVSGHAGVQDAHAWAKTDTFQLLISKNGSRKTEVLIPDQPSKGLVTLQEIVIKDLKPGDEITIYYDRSGSAGPWGFIEGRAVTIKVK